MKTLLTMNIHLKNEGQKCKIGPVEVGCLWKGKDEWRGERRVNKVDV
jgi:hypothetical protein